MDKKRIVALLLVMILCFLNLAFAETDELLGTYTITEGINPSKTTYAGTLNITKTGEVYKLVWNIPFPIYDGIGIIVDHILCVGWSARGGNCGVVVYKVEGGKLKGTWATSDSGAIGTEDLEGPAGLTGVYKIVNSFTPRSGKEYSGTVSINKNGAVYLLNWALARENYTGVGILEDDLLIVGWGSGQTAGIVYYQIKDGILLGRWATPQDTQIGTENLSNISANR